MSWIQHPRHNIPSPQQPFKTLHVRPQILKNRIRPWSLHISRRRPRSRRNRIPTKQRHLLPQIKTRMILRMSRRMNHFNRCTIHFNNITMFQKLKCTPFNPLITPRLNLGNRHPKSFPGRQPLHQLPHILHHISPNLPTPPRRLLDPFKHIPLPNPPLIQLIQPARVAQMSVREKHLRDDGEGREGVAVPCVNEETGRTSTDEVGVGGIESVGP
ncbi:hypothetical protein BC829DRAFT_385786 [Chytridium lagenaria]|nr:hypothetical protein BC829DRAFT_385786 [Chytridium lagenaria]